jgi:hypothetical protein
MPLVFVHGVANRPSAEQAAAIKQRDSLFRSITFGRNDVQIFNPDWGSFAVKFTKGEPWLPNPDNVQAFAAGGSGAADVAGPPAQVGLGEITKTDGVQAVDLAILAVLERDILAKAKGGNPEPDDEVIRLAKAAAQYLAPNLVDDNKKAIVALASANDAAFGTALGEELALVGQGGQQAFGLVDSIKDGISALGGWIGNSTSDALLRLKRQTLSHGAALFLGDIFVYLRQRKVEGADGTRQRLFAPIIADLIKAGNAPPQPKEPLVVVGHSLGGVLLYDILTDDVSLKQITDAVPNLRIDLLLTVGSQPGFSPISGSTRIRRAPRQN